MVDSVDKNCVALSLRRSSAEVGSGLTESSTRVVCRLLFMYYALYQNFRLLSSVKGMVGPVLIEKDGCYLILHRTKKQHDENGDKWIGVGGKFEYGESPEECAMREVKEETGLTMLDPRFRGLVTFVSDEWGVEYMHLFTCTKFSGTLTDCDEGELVWLPKGELLTKKLWEGDKLFLRALDERSDFFTLKLRYEGETLVESKFG